MAVKTWTTERVTSADINTYLTNGGLVWIKEQSVTSSVASVTVSSAFSATYDGYRLVIEHTGTGTGGLYLTMGATTSNTNGWYGCNPYWAANASGDGVIRWNNAATAELGFTTTSNGFSVIDVWFPFDTKNTYVSGIHTSRTNYTGVVSYTLSNTTSYTSFTLANSTGNLSAAKIYVYGYRKQ